MALTHILNIKIIEKQEDQEEEEGGDGEEEEAAAEERVDQRRKGDVGEGEERSKFEQNCN